MTHHITPTIWIIDDSESDHELMKIAFDHIDAPCALESYFSSEDAVEAIRQGKTPSLVLLDLNMPGRGGKYFLEERKRQGYLHIPVTILSSSSNPDDIDDTYSMGANSYLVKPGDFDELLVFAECVSTYWLNLSYLPRPIR